MEYQSAKMKQMESAGYSAGENIIEMENTAHTALILKRTKQFAKNATEMGIATNVWRDTN